MSFELKKNKLTYNNIDSIFKFANSMIELNIQNEVSALDSVILGTASEFGGEPELHTCYDPTSRYHVINGTFPIEKDLNQEISSFEAILLKHKVKIYKPENISQLNQIFSRDIGFVIENKFFISNTIKDRTTEINGIDNILKKISKESIINIPIDIKIEGGDVVLCDNYLFVGYSIKQDFERYQVARTNYLALDFLQDIFPKKKVIGVELKKSDYNREGNSLHLDCSFQPIGKNNAILYSENFCNKSDIDLFINYFGYENIIFIDDNQMYNMCPNVFSISPEVVVSEKSFLKLNKELRSRDFIVEEVGYSEVAKMGGLLRCSTLPLKRR